MLGSAYAREGEPFVRCENVDPALFGNIAFAEDRLPKARSRDPCGGVNRLDWGGTVSVVEVASLEIGFGNSREVAALPVESVDEMFLLL